MCISVSKVVRTGAVLSRERTLEVARRDENTSVLCARTATRTVDAHYLTDHSFGAACH